jgi:hypothetical protein
MEEEKIRKQQTNTAMTRFVMRPEEEEWGEGEREEDEAFDMAFHAVSLVLWDEPQKQMGQWDSSELVRVQAERTEAMEKKE